MIIIYTIVMNPDKTLSTTQKTTLFQGENLADKLCFFLPQTYEEFDLSTCDVFLHYFFPSNVTFYDTLSLDGTYRDKLRYVLPLEARTTLFSGAVAISLCLSHKSDGVTDFKLHSSETSLLIKPANHFLSIQSLLGSFDEESDDSCSGSCNCSENVADDSEVSELLDSIFG